MIHIVQGIKLKNQFVTCPDLVFVFLVCTERHNCEFKAHRQCKNIRVAHKNFCELLKSERSKGWASTFLKY